MAARTPSRRSGHSAQFDPQSGVMVVLGGYRPPRVRFTDLHCLSVHTVEWEVAAGADKPRSPEASSPGSSAPPPTTGAPVAGGHGFNNMLPDLLAHILNAGAAGLAANNELQTALSEAAAASAEAEAGRDARPVRYWMEDESDDPAPSSLISHTSVLDGAILLSFGGSDVDFGLSSSAAFHAVSLAAMLRPDSSHDRMMWRSVALTPLVPIEADPPYPGLDGVAREPLAPEPSYGSTLVLRPDTLELYLFGGTSGRNFFSNLYCLDAAASTIQMLVPPYRGADPLAAMAAGQPVPPCAPHGRYRAAAIATHTHMWIVGGGAVSPLVFLRLSDIDMPPSFRRRFGWSIDEDDIMETFFQVPTSVPVAISMYTYEFATREWRRIVPPSLTGRGLPTDDEVASPSNPTRPQQPMPRRCHSLSYDSVRNVGYMYGGTTGSVVLDDLWQLDLATGAWSCLIAPSTLPEPEPAADGEPGVAALVLDDDLDDGLGEYDYEYGTDDDESDDAGSDEYDEYSESAGSFEGDESVLNNVQGLLDAVAPGGFGPMTPPGSGQGAAASFTAGAVDAAYDAASPGPAPTLDDASRARIHGAIHIPTGPGLPPPTYFHSSVYDSYTQRLVLFGGCLDNDGNNQSSLRRTNKVSVVQIGVPSLEALATTAVACAAQDLRLTRDSLAGVLPSRILDRIFALAPPLGAVQPAIDDSARHEAASTAGQPPGETAGAATLHS
ncbi:kelch domain containing 10 [Thecamonas trahens ATCC 50062]|uniref:Kelch domain containing 10 n=1 Tax=Thecamonas trahens ATCC 50062 TaxID=461836 RepID=A0A0L0D480_THETB|nr:kelch domain containing 10 [Thecamonas trahens ATCC 50062]KNC47114.1 kelch domain containing 10 [Thecamonas trahens ATCC 50062]|eukprot:XP_013759891.1 kelch domain containing 10 [Thecamonas trahens ATCC 50062]